ncbi:hypothetical protein BCR35DRAFT_300361 [Leucosporidium creatinivorum]|uniref:Uncharacterized protein n=1 Tax=Leucosporidium creatinivorum TaxID=106004 RepID=A0A1Y2FYP1_9BASI|nr:hypothetical protein BCR35DRAFT_300361 [Leucosporidium creatinivorum]
MSLAKRIRGSFSNESPAGPPPANADASHPMLRLDFGNNRSPPKMEQPALARLKKQDKKDNKLKNRMSTAFRNFGSSSKSSPPPPMNDRHSPPRHAQEQPHHYPSHPHQHYHPSYQPPHQQQQPYYHPQQQSRGISIPPSGSSNNVKRTNSAPDRQSASLAPKAHRESRPPRRSHTVYAPGASPPLPPLPRNRSIEGPEDPRTQELQTANRRSGFLPSNVLGDGMDGLGLGFEQEVILDPQPPMPMPSPGEYSSATASPASSIEPPSPSLYVPPTPVANKRISFMRKNHQPITRPNSMAVLESMAGTAASLEAKLELEGELSPLPELDNSRARVAVLRKRGSVSAQGTEATPVSQPKPKPEFKLLAVPEGKKKSNKRHTIMDMGSPSDYDQLQRIQAKMEPIESTYKPLPSADAYVLRPTVSVATQTPVWETLSPPLRGPLTHSTPKNVGAWSNTPPQAYTSFPLALVEEPVSPSIYSFVSHAPQNGWSAPPPRRSSYYAPAGPSEIYEEVYQPATSTAEDYRRTVPTPAEAENDTAEGYKALATSPSPQLYAIPDFTGRRRSSIAPPSVPGRSSLPLDPTMQARPQVQTRARPTTVFNPSYAPTAPAKPPQEVVDYDTPYLNPDGSTGLGAYAEGANSLAPTSYSTPVASPAVSPAPYSAPAFATPNPFSTPVPEQRTPNPSTSATLAATEELYAPHSPVPVRRSPRPQSPPVPLRSPSPAPGERRSSTPPSARSARSANTLTSDEEYEPLTPLDDVHPVIAIRKASVVSALSEEASIRRASLVRVSPPSSRPTSLVQNGNGEALSSEVIPEVPPVPLQHRRTSEIVNRVVTRRASEPGLAEAAVPIPGGGGAVPRLRGEGAISRADRMSKGRSFFLVQALSSKPEEVLKRDFLDRAGSGEDSDSDLSSDEDDESVVDVR